jgi:hypothetical protein
MPNSIQLRLPEVVVPGRRLGRNLSHDIRSVPFRVNRTATPKSVKWERHIPILDQGNIGKCVADTGADRLGTGPIWDTLDAGLKKILSTVATAELWTSDLYRELTRSDDYPGAWEPDDTGSDGNTLGKVFTKRGLANGWQHIMSISEAHAAIQQGPFAAGTMWLSDMDSPGPDGVVRVSGNERGGHEYLCDEYDLSRDLWWFANHWTEGYGLRGRFAYDTPGFQKLLDMQGDATVLVPPNQPAPVPTPTPPVPPSPSDPAYRLWLKTVEPEYQMWIKHPIRHRRPFTAAVNAWKLSSD